MKVYIESKGKGKEMKYSYIPLAEVEIEKAKLGEIIKSLKDENELLRKEVHKVRTQFAQILKSIGGVE